MKTDQNLCQDRLMLFPASKTAPPLPDCNFLATRPIKSGKKTKFSLLTSSENRPQAVQARR